MEVVKLKKHIKQVRGVSYGGNDSIDFPREGYIPILRSNNINEGSLNFVDLKYVPSNLVRDIQFLKKGDILITASTGSLKVIGKNGAVNKDHIASFGAFCKVVRPLKTIEANYLKHFFQSEYYRKTIQSVINGANINNIKNEHLDELKIPLPPLATQKRIAAILDEADTLRQLNQQLIDTYNALAQSLFLEMFGDPVINPKGWGKDILKNICYKITDGTHDTPTRLTEGVKFITGKHIKPYFIDYDNSDYVTEEVHNEIYKRCNPQFEDVLYTNIGVNYGTAAMNMVDYEFSMKNVALLKYNREILTGRFIEYILNNENFKDRLKKGFGIGGAQQFLSLTNIKQIEILIPPIDLQNQFAARVKLIEEQKAQAQEALQKSEALFNSLLQRAFNGGL